VEDLLESILHLGKIARSDCIRHKLAGKRERWCRRDLLDGFGHKSAALHNTR